jgi:hypothetical protein
MALEALLKTFLPSFLSHTRNAVTKTWLAPHAMWTESAATPPTVPPIMISRRMPAKQPAWRHMQWAGMRSFSSQICAPCLRGNGQLRLPCMRPVA